MQRLVARAAQPQGHVADVLRSGALREVVGQHAADHHLHDLAHAQLLRQRRGHLLAVLQHRHPLGQLEHLDQSVGDEDDGDAPRPEPVDQVGQHRHLLRGQGGRRLVHDEHLGIVAERLGNLHHLLLGHGKRAQHGRRADQALRFQPLQHGARVLFQLAVVDDAEAVRFAPQEDVLHHRALRQQVKLLIDDADAGVLRLRRVVEDDRRAVEQDGPAVRPIGPGQHLHQRALARAVLADDGVNFAGIERHRHVVERQHTGELLADALHGQHRGHVGRRRCR